MHRQLENPLRERDFGFESGETRTRTGDTTIFSRGSTTGECGLFAATTRDAVAGLRTHTFPRFPRDCGVFGRRFSDLCPNSVAAERAHAECLTVLAARRDRSQRRPPPGPLRRRELDVLTVVGHQVGVWGRVGRAIGVGRCCSGSVVCLPSAAWSAPAPAARKPLASLGLGRSAALRVRCAALLAPVAALSDTQPPREVGQGRTP
jgi:hypothetical protein